MVSWTCPGESTGLDLESMADLTDNNEEEMFRCRRGKEGSFLSAASIISTENLLREESDSGYLSSI